MYCERCGPFVLFRKICQECAQFAQAQGTDQPAASGPAPVKVPGLRLGSHIKMTRMMSISMNRKKISFNLSGGITDNLIRQVADQANLTPEEARSLLEAQGSPERMVEVGSPIAQAHHLGPVKCPSCGLDVPAGKFCSQCGHSLA